MSFLSIDIFNQIINREIPADIVFETETMIAFRDINPKANVHILIVPKQALKTAKDVHNDNLSLFGELFFVAKQVAEMEGINGYKLHMNVDESGGQVIPRVHLHLLSPDFECDL
ncbi:HIT domain-containing protein [Candidatus Gracilibacteria bacterium]|nr:HIT domain-containing protein [Candidatus Gracilibacteria bacterium]